MTRSTSASSVPRSAGVLLALFLAVAACTSYSDTTIDRLGAAANRAELEVDVAQQEGDLWDCDCGLDPCECPLDGFYVGGSIGYADARVSGTDLEGRLAGQGINASASLDDTGLGWKGYLGYRFQIPLAVELGYTSIDGIDSTVSAASNPPMLGPIVRGEHPVTGRGITFGGLVPLEWDRFSVFGKLGVWYWKSDVKINLGSTALEFGAEGVDFFTGAGTQYFVTRNIALRAEFERYFVDNGDADLWSLGGIVRF